jgi:hypothetical protein
MTVKSSDALMLLLALAALVGLLFIQSPGTPDVGAWLSWTNNALTHGLRVGYATNNDVYPPLASVILYCSNQFFSRFNVTNFIAIKLSILFFLWLSTFFCWLWTEDLKIVLVLYFSLLLNSVALGYIDIYFAPSLIVALWMLKERRFVFFSLFYAIACLTKWQPLIIGPFIGVYIMSISNLWKGRLSSIYWIVSQILLPAGSVVALTLATFGAGPIWQAFQLALSDEYLSGDALNLNWIVTYFLHLSSPGEFGSLKNGLANYIVLVHDLGAITLIPRILFFATYLVLLLVFIRGEQTFENLLRHSILGLLSYYIFNIGVHENHLFLGVILAIILFWSQQSFRSTAVLIIVISNLNLFLFYGVDGKLHFERAFLGIDMSLPLAFFNVICFLFLFGDHLKNSLSLRGSNSPLGPMGLKNPSSLVGCTPEGRKAASLDPCD